MTADGEAGGVRLRAATAEDRFRIRRWLTEPGVKAWWGTAAGAEAEITLAMATEAALARIIECDGAAAGYAHAVESGLWGGANPPELAPGTWKVDLFIAAGPHGDRGLALTALTLLVDEVFATTLALACCAVVSVRNEAAARAYEAAGFRWLRVWPDRTAGPSWVMLRERAA